VRKLQVHFCQTVKDIEQIRISTEKVMRRSGKIEALDFEDEASAGALDAPRTAAE